MAVAPRGDRRVQPRRLGRAPGPHGRARHRPRRRGAAARARPALPRRRRHGSAAGAASRTGTGRGRRRCSSRSARPRRTRSPSRRSWTPATTPWSWSRATARSAVRAQRRRSRGRVPARPRAAAGAPTSPRSAPPCGPRREAARGDEPEQPGRHDPRRRPRWTPSSPPRSARARGCSPTRSTAAASGSTDAVTPTFWGRTERVVCVGSLSKAFGLPGLRVGWLVAPPALLQAAWRRHEYATIATSKLSMHLAERALEPGGARPAADAQPRARAGGLRPARRLDRRHGGLLSIVPPAATALGFVRYALDAPSLEVADALRTRGRRAGRARRALRRRAPPAHHARARARLPRRRARADRRGAARLGPRGNSGRAGPVNAPCPPPAHLRARLARAAPPRCSPRPATRPRPPCSPGSWPARSARRRSRSGVIEGVASAADGVARLGGGALAEDPRRRRRISFGSHAGITALTGLMAVAASSWQVGALRAGASTARGLRSPQRYASVPERAGSDGYGRLFGVERSLHHLAAVAGPLLAFVLLAFGRRPLGAAGRRRSRRARGRDRAVDHAPRAGARRRARAGRCSCRSARSTPAASGG